MTNNEIDRLERAIEIQKTLQKRQEELREKVRLLEEKIRVVRT